VLSRTYTDGDRDFFSLTGIVLLPFSNPTQLLPEATLWRFVAQQLGKDAVLDIGMPKKNGEFLVSGKCHVANNSPVEAMAVKVKVGLLEKSLTVMGDRLCKLVKSRREVSKPMAFTEMSMSYANAFGGVGFERNPLGKGLPLAEDGAPYPLPNVLNPNESVVSMDDRPEPASFAPLDFLWPQRFSKAGTYDDAWYQTRFPNFAKDMDWSIFNTAQPDQWLPGFFKGDERIEVSGMHPDVPVQSTQLPAYRVRCFITEKTETEEAFREVPMQPETLWLFPNASHMVLIYRGVLEIGTDDASSVLHLVAGIEALGEPKPVQHYRSVLAQRLDKRRGAVHALDDGPLLPTGLLELAPMAEVADMQAKSQSQGFLADHMRRKAEKQLQQAKEQAVAQRAQILDIAHANGAAPPDLSALDQLIATTLPPSMPTPRIEDLPQILAESEREVETARASALAKQAELKAQMAALSAQTGTDISKLAKAPPAPRFSAEKALNEIRLASASGKATRQASPVLDALLGDPKLTSRLQQAEAASLQAYRLGAQHYGPTDVGIQAQFLRTKVQTGLARKASFANQDLTGADLHGLDLSGADFSNALMESVDLRQANLTGAKLTGALIAHAKLDGANLAGANLVGANLGKASMVGTRALDTDFSRAVLDQANLRNADLTGARLDSAKLGSVKLAGAILVRASLVDTQLMDIFRDQPSALEAPVEPVAPEEAPGLDLRSTNFSQANMKGVMLLNSQLDGAVLKGVCLDGATLLGVSATGADFSGATFVNARAVKGSRFDRAVFKGADISKANFRSAGLDRADLSGACLQNADLSEATLRLAILTGANAKGLRAAKVDLSNARMAGANLHGAILQKANISGADLTNASLYMADLLKVKRDQFTLLDGANLKRTVLKASPDDS